MLAEAIIELSKTLTGQRKALLDLVLDAIRGYYYFDKEPDVQRLQSVCSEIGQDTYIALRALVGMTEYAIIVHPQLQDYIHVVQLPAMASPRYFVSSGLVEIPPSLLTPYRVNAVAITERAVPCREFAKLLANGGNHIESLAHEGAFIDVETGELLTRHRHTSACDLLGRQEHLWFAQALITAMRSTASLENLEVRRKEGVAELHRCIANNDRLVRAFGKPNMLTSIKLTGLSKDDLVVTIAGNELDIAPEHIAPLGELS